MNRVAIILLIFLGLVIGHMYWFGIIKGGSSSKCASAKNKFECEVARAAIEQGRRECNSACGSKKEWNAHCEDQEMLCKDDCMLEGNDSTCKSKCSQELSECKASYKNKKQCKSMCKKIYK